MQYNRQFGGSILDKRTASPRSTRPPISPASSPIRSCSTKAAPPGAADYDWGGREESFKQGLVANMQTWSIGAASYDDPASSKVVGKNAIMLTPSAKGQPQKYGIGGWALGINADIDAKKKDAAWAFIKWATSPPVHKEMNMHGAGSYLRKSELTDPELAGQISVSARHRHLVRKRRRRFPAAHPAISGIAGPDRRGDQRGAGRSDRPQGRDGRYPGQGRGAIQVRLSRTGGRGGGIEGPGVFVKSETSRPIASRRSQ